MTLLSTAVPIAVSAAGVVAVVVVGRRSGSASERAAAAAERSADAAQQSLAAARASVATAEKARQETERTRIDMTAPRLALRGARADRPLLGDPSDYTSRVEPWPGFEPDLAIEGGRTLYIRGWVKVLNEGRGTAFVTLPAHAYPTAFQVDHPVGNPIVQADPQPQLVELPAGESVWLCLEAGHRLAQWSVGNTPVEVPFRLESRGGYSDGVLDVAIVTVTARPLLPRQTGSSVFLISSEPPQIRCSAIHRSYGNDDPLA